MRQLRGRVLVVDDDRAVAATLRDMLILELGYGVKIAITGEEGIGVADVYRPDVVLLDINLPGMRGDQVPFNASPPSRSSW